VGFAHPEGAAAHPGYGPAADSATHHELVRLATFDHPQVGRYRAMKEPVKFTDTPGSGANPGSNLWPA
jgi:hypothetical protein